MNFIAASVPIVVMASMAIHRGRAVVKVRKKA
jgi:hypothetical protein